MKARLLFDLHRADGVSVIPAGTVLDCTWPSTSTTKVRLPGGGYAAVGLDQVEILPAEASQ